MIVRPTACFVLLAAVLCGAHAGEEARMTPIDTPGAELAWQTVNDNVMGGRSRGGHTREGGTLVFAGSTNTRGGGFSSIRASLPEVLDLSGGRWPRAARSR